MKKAWVVTTIFNRAENIPAYLDRLSSQDYPDTNLVLIDHGTKPIDPTSLPDFVTYLRGTPDKWWTGAMNIGIRHLLENLKIPNEDYIIFQNEDVDFSNSLISQLVKQSDKNNGAVVGGVTIDKDSNTVLDADNHLSILHAKHICPHRGKPAEELPKEPIHCNIMKGRGVIYPVKVVREIGYLNEKMARRSDPEFAFRAFKLGHKVITDPNIRVVSSLDSRTLFRGRLTTEDIYNFLFSPRSYANIPDAFHYFYACLDPIRGTYCFALDTTRSILYISLKYILSVVKNPKAAS